MHHSLKSCQNVLLLIKGYLLFSKIFVLTAMLEIPVEMELGIISPSPIWSFLIQTNLDKSNLSYQLEMNILEFYFHSPSSIGTRITDLWKISSCDSYLMCYNIGVFWVHSNNIIIFKPFPRNLYRFLTKNCIYWIA